jgi:hypothetical protein
MAGEVRRREERERGIGQDGLLLELGVDPEDDDIGIALAGRGIDGVRARVAEEKEAPPAHLVDGGSAFSRQPHARQGAGHLVDIVYRRWARADDIGLTASHGPMLARLRPARRLPCCRPR